MGGSSSRPIPIENRRRTRRNNNNNKNNNNNDTNENENAPKKRCIACNKIETIQRLLCGDDVDTSDIPKLFKTVYSAASRRQEPVDMPNIRTTAKTQLLRLKELVCRVEAKKLDKDDVKVLAKKVMTLTKNFKDD
jgi:hypothetical protein